MIPQLINEFLTKWFGASWKTTLGGIVGAVAIAITPVIQTGTIDKKALIMAAAVGLLGWLAKDHG